MQRRCDTHTIIGSSGSRSDRIEVGKQYGMVYPCKPALKNIILTCITPTPSPVVSAIDFDEDIISLERLNLSAGFVIFRCYAIGSAGFILTHSFARKLEHRLNLWVLKIDGRTENDSLVPLAVQV